MKKKLPTISSKLRKKLLFAVFAAFAVLTDSDPIGGCS